MLAVLSEICASVDDRELAVIVAEQAIALCRAIGDWDGEQRARTILAQTAHTDAV